MIQVKMPIRQAQFILDTFRAVRFAPFLHANKPVFISGQSELEAMLQRIRDAKAVIAVEFTQMKKRDLAEFSRREISVSFTDQDLADTIAVLRSAIGEAQGNPAHIHALIGTVDDIQVLLDMLLREQKRGDWTLKKD